MPKNKIPSKNVILMINKNIIFELFAVNKIIPVIQLSFFHSQLNILIQTSLLKNVLVVLKNHFAYYFKSLTYIAGSDYPENYYRFSVFYELLSIKYNTRLRIKVIVSESIPIDSIEKIFNGADWWESEIWDLFGVFFLNKKNLTRLLTDYGFQGYPLRKDFPITGFSEPRFSVTKNRIIYENVELTQHFRKPGEISPWAPVGVYTPASSVTEKAGALPILKEPWAEQ